MAEEEKSKTLIDEANAAAERLEKANERTAELLRQQEEFRATDILSGKAEQPKPEKRPEISPQEYAQNALKGIIPEK